MGTGLEKWGKRHEWKRRREDDSSLVRPRRSDQSLHPPIFGNQGLFKARYKV